MTFFEAEKENPVLHIIIGTHTANREEETE